jgi:hypothetical protein
MAYDESPVQRAIRQRETANNRGELLTPQEIESRKVSDETSRVQIAQNQAYEDERKKLDSETPFQRKERLKAPEVRTYKGSGATVVPGSEFTRDANTGQMVPVVRQENVIAQQPVAAPVAPVSQPVEAPAVVAPVGNRRSLMTQTFNALPNQGRDLRIAGRGQTGGVNPADQAIFDAKYRELAALQAQGRKPVATAVAPAAPPLPVTPLAVPAAAPVVPAATPAVAPVVTPVATTPVAKVNPPEVIDAVVKKKKMMMDDYAPQGAGGTFPPHTAFDPVAMPVADTPEQKLAKADVLRKQQYGY